MRTPFKPAAFTLVELLVVISIISLLISILLPALESARKSSRQIVCATRLKQVGLTIGLYTNDAKEYFPVPTDSPTLNAGSVGWLESKFVPAYGPTWAEYMANVYMNGSKRMLECTERPSAGVATGYYVHYGINQNLASGAATGWQRTVEMRKPSDVIMSMDTTNNYLTPTSGFYVFGDWGRAHLRHQGGANLLYVDQHVKYYKMKQDSASCNTPGHPLYGPEHLSR